MTTIETYNATAVLEHLLRSRRAASLHDIRNAAKASGWRAEVKRSPPDGWEVISMKAGAGIEPLVEVVL